jgi:hypothetical protein
MLSQVFYLIRSQQDGQYLVARPQLDATQSKAATDPGYLLVFREHADALSYLNTHAFGLADRFAVESLASTQLSGLLNRWKFNGLGIIEDPLLPRIEFLKHQ